MRAAIYYTPPQDNCLTRLGAEWLGRDAFDGRATRLPDADLDALVADPARYGFHATLKAPFRLRDEGDLSAIGEALASFCAGRAGASIRHLALARLGSFFALVPDGPEPSLMDLEAAIVERFEPFRAPLSEAEIARRRPERLTERQRAYLDTWGYPYVLDEFRFHMSLTGPVEDGAEALHRELADRFAPVVGRPLALSGLALFVEDEPGAPFRVHGYHRFGAATASRKLTQESLTS